jgi:COP9 signalosome complex subunit 1
LIGRLSYIPTLIFSTPSQSPTTLALARTALLRLIPLLRGTLYNTALAYLARISAESTGAGARDDSMGADEASAVSGKEAEGIPDNEWIEEAGETERKENSRLDVELRGYMSNLIKESIRVSTAGSDHDSLEHP